MSNTFWRNTKSSTDDWQTPIQYLKIIDLYIDKDTRINDPFWCSGLVKEKWKELGRDIIHEPTDFFTDDYDTTDIIVGNPPFSILADVLVKLFEIGKPFAILIPIGKIAQIKIQKILRNHNIQLIVANCYTGFYTSNGKPSRCPTSYYSWLVYKFNLEKDLIFI